jgi:geranylgeranyl diphosphate synthase type II
MDFESCEQVSAAEHLAMIELKTAALFVGAVSMGAVVGGASEAQVARLREFALQFGVAFQMQDDLLDSYGDARLGKTVGGDILEGKKTFLKMQALASAGGAASGSGSSAVSAASGGAASASADDRAELELIHKDLRFSSEEKIARVLSLYERYGVRESVEREISRRFAAAAAALDSLAGEASGTAGTAVGASSAGGVDPARLAAFKSFALSQLGRTK